MFATKQEALLKAQERAERIKLDLMPGQLYEDNEISLSSYLSACRTSYTVPSSQVKWHRPSQISEQPELFCDGAHSSDIIQGRLGDCWFLGALSCVATREDLLMPLIAGAYTEYGFYQFLFFKHGSWDAITIDDRLAIRRGKLLYARCPDPNEFWVPLIEKAYAKLHGCYDNLSGGSPAYALADLTGGQCEKISVKPQDIVKTWNYLTRSINERWLMGASVFNAKAAVEEERPDGLLVNHAYGLLDCIKIDNIKLVKLRNPWGRKEWNGAWSDTSDEWNGKIGSQIKAMTSYTLGDDGCFFMRIEDFCRIFNKLYTVRLYQDSIGAVWPFSRLSGCWKDVTAPGCQNPITLARNPQYILGPITRQIEIFITLSQRDERLGSRTKHVNMGFFLCRALSNRRQAKVDKSTLIVMTLFSNAREISTNLILDQGYYVIVPSTYYPREQTTFVLTVSADRDIQVKAV